MYLEYECEHCGFEFCTIDTKEADYDAMLQCTNCWKHSVVKIKITAVGLPLKED